MLDAVLSPQALPLLLACLHDLRNPGDLTLRQAAATSLERFITAAVAIAASASAGGVATPAISSTGDGGHSQLLLCHLVTRVLYPQLKSQLSVPSLAVRQEHLALLRALVIAFPAK
jgi:U3 small nucleolar RNA-associated protein 20